ncbi:MAG: hypothetical protein JSS02_15350 [Planctomycetes bacterium]|nr:hypothetical protein [Planctomycetota bacterium]
MAAVARQRACQLLSAQDQKAGSAASAAAPVPGAGAAEPSERAVGVSCTASLVSDRPKKGDHRCHVATQTLSRTASCSLVLEKGARDRRSEDRLVGQLIVRALAEAVGIADLPALDLRPGEEVLRHEALTDPLLMELLGGQRAVVWSVLREVAGLDMDPGTVTERTFQSALPAQPAGLLCGSFHPLHDGHRQMRAVAEQILKGPVYYEISVRNVDKPPLDFLSIARRSRQFHDVPLALTSAPTFAEKSAALPGVTFVVGVDTAERIVKAKYYGGGAEATRHALTQVRAHGCRFLVAGRLVGERFETLADVEVPVEFQDLFTAIPAEAFRVDLSSTQLRRAGHCEGELPAESPKAQH